MTLHKLKLDFSFSMKSSQFMIVQPLSLIHRNQKFHPDYKHPPTQQNNNIFTIGKLTLQNSTTTTNPIMPKSDDLFKCMKAFLIFGKLIGLVPISGIFKSDFHQLKFRQLQVYLLNV